MEISSILRVWRVFDFGFCRLRGFNGVVWVLRAGLFAFRACLLFWITGVFVLMVVSGWGLLVNFGFWFILRGFGFLGLLALRWLGLT